MIETSNKEIEFADVQSLIFKYPYLKDRIVVLECTLNLFKFEDLSRCTTAAKKLNKFFRGDIINSVMFQHENPVDANIIKGVFTGTFPLSDRNLNLFLDLLVLNLISAGTVAFDDKMIILTEKEKFIINQKILIEH